MTTGADGPADSGSLLSYDDALAVVRRLIEVADARGETIGSPIVLVGGTAMAAWGIRAHSKDVDLYTSHVPEQAVEAVEHELRAIYGAAFRLDVTSGENLWGPILVRDIESSPILGTIHSRHELRALSVEDLYLLKLASARAKDLADLALLAPRTTADAVLDRWNRLARWHGDRHAVLGFADAFVAELARWSGLTPSKIIERLHVTPGQREELIAAHGEGLDEPS